MCAKGDKTRRSCEPAISLESFTFTFAGCDEPVLDDVTLSVPEGAFCVLCGPTGSGKTTLLRAMKPQLTPTGTASGNVRLLGYAKDAMPPEISATAIGFVMQDPNAQAVAGTVADELAFGLENLGLSGDEIRRRMAETADFMGVSSSSQMSVAELSGGSRQLLNLASSVALHPRLLILDEPTSQLDVRAARGLIDVLIRLNREVGVTIILSEHRLEDVLACADQVLFLEGGKLLFDGCPSDFAAWSCGCAERLDGALPAAARMVAAVSSADVSGLKADEEDAGTRASSSLLPLTVREGREWLRQRVGQTDGNPDAAECGQAAAPTADDSAADVAEDLLVEANDIWFRYGRDDDFVLRGATLSLPAGRVLALIGGNACGKSTLLGVLSGVLKPARGSIRRKTGVSVACMPQDPRDVFICDSVSQELHELQSRFSYTDAAVDKTVEQLHLGHLLNRHPLDLSGGEMQLVALAKMLLLEPDVLLFDEATKGLDALAKQNLHGLIAELRDEGLGIVLVTHDLEFVAEVADSCSSMVDGTLTGFEPTRTFLERNVLVTTGAARICRGILPGCITVDDATAHLVGGRAHA